MAFIYNVYERDNKIPNAKTARIAVAYNRQIRQISTKELAADISDRCTVHRADVQAVLEALSISATNYLLNGFGVKLGELGSLSVALRSKGAPSLEEFTPDMLLGAKVRFTPSRDILNKVKENGFVRASTLTTATGAPEKPKAPEETSSPEPGAGSPDEGAGVNEGGY